jgi:hypothetical protein
MPVEFYLDKLKIAAFLLWFLPLNTADDVRGLEHQRKRDEVTEQNPQQEHIGQFSSGGTYDWGVVVPEENAADK